MVESELTSIQEIALHKVGNKLNDENIYLSNSPLKISEVISSLLIKYFLTPFKKSEYYNFYHESDLLLNVIYSSVSYIFNNPDEFYKQSVNIAQHLYEQSTHPKIKAGELYVCLLKDCIIDGETLDAVGIFKSESKETFLKVYPEGNNYNIESEDGININKLDKGCLIFNTEQEKGYLVTVIDNISKSSEARYWIDDFLHLRQREDEYFQTQNLMKLCKSFVTEHLPDEFDVDKADQADILNKSVKFLKEKEEFTMDDFANEVMQAPELIDNFKDYKQQYEQEFDIVIANEFNISEDAVKKQARVFKSIIKLDKNFHIYVHGNRQYIQKGYDENTGMHYYQLFYKDEN